MVPTLLFYIRQPKATGDDGKDGKDGDSQFSNIDVTNKDYVIFTLKDGETIKLPTWTAFETLQEKVNQINNNIVNLQNIISALEDKDYVTSIVPILQGGEEIGYTINFTKSTPVTIYHGKKGDTGEAGKDGETPSIGVKQDNGIYYWTLNGDFLTDENNNKIKAEGRDGTNGSDGTDGKDGITPKLKIDGGYWYLSTDGGLNWEKLGQATGDTGATGPVGPAGPSGPAGADGTSPFESIEDTGDSIVITLSNGTIITLPKYVTFSISFSQLYDYQVTPGKVIEIDFTVTGGGDDMKFNVVGGYKSSVTLTKGGNNSVTGGKITLMASLDEKTEQIMLFAKSGQNNSWESFSITTGYDYAEIGDVYYQSGNPIGLIWKKREGGQKGMVISGVESEQLHWNGGVTGYATPATWVKDELGSPWRVPEVNELVQCFETIVDYNWEQFDERMTDLGFKEISTTLWSATKGTTGRYVVSKTSSGIEREDISVGNSRKVRAVREF